MRLLDVDSGALRYRGTDLMALDRAGMRPHRAGLQMVFQDPYASLNPRSRVGRIVADGPVTLGTPRPEAERRAREMLELVGLEASAFDRYPHEFSGGQRQRVGIARALALEPEALVADEPVSALDVSVQAQVLELLARIREELGLSMVFITHDLRVAAQVCDRIAVMRLGQVVELGPTAELFERASHGYTRELIAAVPGRSWSGGAGVAGRGTTVRPGRSDQGRSAGRPVVLVGVQPRIVGVQVQQLSVDDDDELRAGGARGLAGAHGGAAHRGQGRHEVGVRRAVGGERAHRLQSRGTGVRCEASYRIHRSTKGA